MAAYVPPFRRQHATSETGADHGLRASGLGKGDFVDPKEPKGKTKWSTGKDGAKGKRRGEGKGNQSIGKGMEAKGKGEGNNNLIELRGMVEKCSIKDECHEPMGAAKNGEGDGGRHNKMPEIHVQKKMEDYAANDLFIFIERQGCMINRDELSRFYKGHKNGHTRVIFQDHARSDKEFLDLYPHMFKHDEHKIELMVEWPPEMQIQEMIEKRFGVAYHLCVALAEDVNGSGTSEHRVKQIVEQEAAVELPCRPFYDEVRREFIVACSSRADLEELRQCKTLEVKPFLLWPEGMQVTTLHELVHEKGANFRHLIVNDKLMAYLHNVDWCGQKDSAKDIYAEIQKRANIKLPVLPMKGCTKAPNGEWRHFAFVACQTEDDRQKMIETFGIYRCQPKGRNVTKGNHKPKADPTKPPSDEIAEPFREWDEKGHRIHIQVDLNTIAEQVNDQVGVKKYPEKVSKIHDLIDALRRHNWRPRKDGGCFVEAESREANKGADWLAELVLDEGKDLVRRCDRDALRKAMLASSCKVKVFADGSERNMGTDGLGSIAAAAWIGYIQEIDGVPNSERPFAEIGKYLGNVNSTVAEYSALELALQDIVNMLPGHSQLVCSDAE